MRLPRIVVDTNVLIAGLRSRDGHAFQLLQFVGKGEFDIHLSVPLVMEYEAILYRELPNLLVSLATVDDMLDYWCEVGKQHEIFFLWRPFLRDPGDDMVLEITVKAECEFIITYNQKHFSGIEQFGIKALTPGAFLAKNTGVKRK
jgi:putative PIN family toxin of toxin-antitoxin system